MANRNDYNYYKNEYGKYKDNYYSPGSEAYKKRKRSSAKQKAGRIFRAVIVFILIAAIVVGVVYGIIKLTRLIRSKAPKEETTTSVTEIIEKETTTKKQEGTSNVATEIKISAKYTIKTNDGNGVYLRSEPNNNGKKFSLIPDGEIIVAGQVSEDGLWCKSSNLDMNGWVNIKYLVPVSTEETTEETTTKVPEEITTKKPEQQTEPSTELDTDIKSYADAVKAFKAKGDGTVMNCKIVGSDAVFATAQPDKSSTRLLYLVPGDKITVIGVNDSYSKVKSSEGYIAWVPNENLTFVSWG